MRHTWIALALVAACVGTAAAEPLEWNYRTRFKAPSKAKSILLGQEIYSEFNNGVETNTNYYAYLTVGAGLTRSGTATAGAWNEVYTFGNGDWSLSTVIPTNAADRQFAFLLTLTDADGNTADIAPQLGSISAGGFFTTGTGNFSIGFEGMQDVILGDRIARVTFGTRESESANRVTFMVEDAGPVQSPEPATFVLAGIGLAGVIGTGVARRRMK